jgi:hypothetical protein
MSYRILQKAYIIHRFGSDHSNLQQSKLHSLFSSDLFIHTFTKPINYKILKNLWRS